MVDSPEDLLDAIGSKSKIDAGRSLLKSRSQIGWPAGGIPSVGCRQNDG